MEAGTGEIFVTAPGKVILFGEHAVVYGKPALAASLDLCTFVHAKRRCDEYIEINLTDFHKSFRWNVRHIAESFRGIMHKDVHSVAVLSTDDIEQLYLFAKQHDVGLHRNQSPLLVFLYLYLAIVGSEGNELIPLDVEVASCLPIGAGLGSSASYTTCLSAVMLRFVKAIGEKELSGADLHLVNRWAFSAEHILHGKPSGVDNAVSVFGGLINFKAGQITPMKCPVVLEVVLIDTKVVRETKNLVDKVSKRNSDWPTVIQPVLEAIGSITETVRNIFTNVDLTNIDLDELNQLVDMNQGLLITLGVSHPKLDEICQIAAQNGFSAKLTGAGGGGCAFFLVPPGCQGLAELMIDFDRKGFRCWRTKFGGSGLMLHQNIEAFKQSRNNIPKYVVQQHV